MIKTFTATLLLLLSFTIKAQNVNIPDANFKQALIANIAINTNEDDEISEDEAAALTGVLYVSNKGISDLTGIEYFINITVLYCSDNQLNRLNLSENTKLTSLNCSQNQLSNINLSENPQLTHLNCKKNQLKSLDISYIIDLESLECDDNRLPFSELQKIKQFYAELTYKYPNKIFSPIEESDGFKLNYSAEALLGKNETTFKWYDWNNSIVEDDVINEISTGVFQFLKAGIFHCKMTNETFPDIELTTESISINNETINIPDVKLKQILIEASNININGDSEISESEAATSITINVSNKRISDLTGIEYFINIKYLNCRSNQINSLDLSNNTKLTELYCSDNQLASLNTNNSPELAELNCRNNKLENLDVDINAELKYLNCNGNQINSLNLSNNTKLTELDCSNNQLSHLDLSKSREITILKCKNNQLTYIDISKNTAITDLDCAYNNLTGLDLNNNREIAILECHANELTNISIDKNTKITSLICSYNQLTSINISKNTKITSLKCSSNQLTDINISKNALLTYLDLNSNQLTSLDLNNNTEITSLQCSYNQLTSLNLSLNTAINRLTCFDNQLTNLDISKNTKLTDLNCSNNKIIFSELQKIKTHYPTLNYTTYKKIFSITEEPENYQVDYSSEVFVNNNKTIFTWHNEYNREVSDEYVNEENKGIFKFLKEGTYYCKMTNATFPELTLRTNDISIYSQNPIEISDAYFKRALIENNLINIDGNAEISEYEATKFRGEINVGNKNISDLTGIEYFTNITKLTCYGNQLNNLDISKNTELTELNCSGNLLNNLNISQNRQLKILNCAYNQLSILKLSDHNSTLTNLSYDQNRLPFTQLSEIKLFYPALIASHQLKVFSIVENKIDYEIDYSDEALFAGNETSFSWFKNSESSEVDENTVQKLSPGIYRFLKAGVYRCEMTNKTFPGTTITTENITINGKDQSISIEDLPTGVRMSDVLEIKATASSGLEVSFELVSGNAGISGNSITFNEEGTIVIKAIQAGNDEFTAAEKDIEFQVDFVTGVDDVLKSSIQMYPNPVERELNIQFENNEKYTISIYNILGNLKLQEESFSNKAKLNLSGFKNGMYLMRIQFENESMTYKIIKK